MIRTRSTSSVICYRIPSNRPTTKNAKPPADPAAAEDQGVASSATEVLRLSQDSLRWHLAACTDWCWRPHCGANLHDAALFVSAGLL